MTIAMPDSIYPDQLPLGFPAYLGYVDGRWPTYATLKAKFPGAHIIGLTVRGGSTVADGCDCENGDLTPGAAITWAANQLDGGRRPIIYANASTMNGAIVPGLDLLRIPRSSVRLLSAHYGQGKHICGPRSCGLVTVDMDGTQWTDAYPGMKFDPIDMSALDPGFFGTAPVPTWTEKILQQLPILKQGSTGNAVRTVQGLCNARLVFRKPLTIDGVFGSATLTSVETIQASAHLTPDGVVGPKTWPVLLGIA